MRERRYAVPDVKNKPKDRNPPSHKTGNQKQVEGMWGLVTDSEVMENLKSSKSRKDVWFGSVVQSNEMPLHGTTAGQTGSFAWV